MLTRVSVRVRARVFVRACACAGGACVFQALVYVSNILENPDEDKFKQLKKSNAALQRRLLSKPGGEELLLNLGFSPQVV